MCVFNIIFHSFQTEDGQKIGVIERQVCELIVPLDKKWQKLPLYAYMESLSATVCLCDLIVTCRKKKTSIVCYQSAITGTL